MKLFHILQVLLEFKSHGTLFCQIDHITLPYPELLLEIRIKAHTVNLIIKCSLSDRLTFWCTVHRYNTNNALSRPQTQTECVTTSLKPFAKHGGKKFVFYQMLWFPYRRKTQNTFKKLQNLVLAWKRAQSAGSSWPLGVHTLEAPDRQIRVGYNKLSWTWHWRACCMLSARPLVISDAPTWLYCQTYKQK